MNEEIRQRKRRALNVADINGEIADSLKVRDGIMQRVRDGEITLKQGQDELAKIKRAAKRNGKLTRSQKWSGA
tara:strand:- start:181 stop:399 length:219 start_codon:yes stop_codon:yes gene_type:complete